MFMLYLGICDGHPFAKSKLKKKQFSLVIWERKHSDFSSSDFSCIFSFAYFFFCREILPCLKLVVKNGYSSLTMAALMRKISGRRNTLHLLQNPRGGPGEP